MSSRSDDMSALTTAQAARLADLRAATGLQDIRALTGADTDHEAYFLAKDEWRTLRDRELPPPHPTTDLAGTCVEVDGRQYWVHGVTHADSDVERSFLRDHVTTFLAEGDAVYCEQGIRQMYFEEFSDVCEMDDYRWAITKLEEFPEGHDTSEYSGLLEDITSITTRFRDQVFALIESGGDVYGEAFSKALGDVASQFLMSHEDIARGNDFASFALSRDAAEDPRKLPELHRYYQTQFLPQPVEREWLRNHDPELEIVSHARNERMADYVVYHNDSADTVHLIVGAAHQPGIVYYLDEYRTGHRTPDAFEHIG